MSISSLRPASAAFNGSLTTVSPGIACIRSVWISPPRLSWTGVSDANHTYTCNAKIWSRSHLLQSRSSKSLMSTCGSPGCAANFGAYSTARTAVTFATCASTSPVKGSERRAALRARSASSRP
eukprot:537288-Rhodomonas_salina.2